MRTEICKELDEFLSLSFSLSLVEGSGPNTEQASEREVIVWLSERPLAICAAKYSGGVACMCTKFCQE